MSTINVTNLSGRGGATPNLPDGANITGVATASGGFIGNITGNIVSSGISTLGNVVITGAVGGGATVGAYAGVTTFYGDGSGLTGVGESIAPWHYNPPVSGLLAKVATGIGITFNKKIIAGSGTATIKIVNAGAAGTTIQSWGVSSCTFGVTNLTFGDLVSPLTINQTYQVDIPATFIDDSAGSSYVGTAYTFAAQGAARSLWTWGAGNDGGLGTNATSHISSPTQVPGVSWGYVTSSKANGDNLMLATKTDGSLWSWGRGGTGQNGNSTTISYSSPIQIGTDSDWDKSSRQKVSCARSTKAAIKTDGTLWTWGNSSYGDLGNNTGPGNHVSSPIQIPGTTWKALSSGQNYMSLATKTDGTLWAWGHNGDGLLGQNAPENSARSSPVQIPGTNWDVPIQAGYRISGASKTDGTLWIWGYNNYGQLGINDLSNKLQVSSPIQVPGTTWNAANLAGYAFHAKAVKTDGTLWSWGNNQFGMLGQNSETKYSSPVQIPGTNWNTVSSAYMASVVTKTDGTLWSWGYGLMGNLGHNQSASPAHKSSPVQVGSETDWVAAGGGTYMSYAIREDTTP